MKLRVQQPAQSGTQTPVQPLSLRRNFSWTLVGNIVYAASQWGMLTVLAKLGSPEVVGQFALGLAVTAPVIMFGNLQLRGVQASDVRQDYAFGDYLGLRLCTTALVLMVIIGVALASGYRQETGFVILFVGLAKAFEAISDVYYGLLQQHEQMNRIAKSMMLRGCLSLLVLCLGMYFSGSIFWGTLGLAVVWGLILIAYDIPTSIAIQGRAVLHPQWTWSTLFRLTSLSLPLGFVMLLISLNTNIPRYAIERYLGERELGIFAALSYVMVAGTTIVTALGQSATPRLSRYYATGNIAAFRSLLMKLVGFGGLLGGLGILVVGVAGRQILTLLYRPEYADYSLVFVLAMIAAGLGFMSSFLGYGLTAARYFKAQAPLYSISLASTALFCTWLIPAYGLMGAAGALIIAVLVQILGGLLVITHALWALNRTPAA